MIFIVILLGLTIICLTILFLIRKKNNFFIESIFMSLTVIFIVSMLAMGVCLIACNIRAEADNKVYTERYISLLYKAHTIGIRDELGLDNKEYIDDIQEWNEEYVRIKTYQESPWLKDFYPEKLLLGLDRINVTDVEF